MLAGKHKHLTDTNAALSQTLIGTPQQQPWGSYYQNSMPGNSQSSAQLDPTCLASNWSVSSNSQPKVTPFTCFGWEVNLILVPSTLTPTDFKVTTQPTKNNIYF